MKQLKHLCDKIFLEHPRDAGEPYFSHLFFTVYVAGHLIMTACCAVLHGLFPVILTTATSSRVNHLNILMQERCERLKAGKKQCGEN